MAGEGFDTFVLRARLVRDVTDTDCWTHTARSPDRVFMTYEHALVTNTISERKKEEKRLLCVCFIFHVLQ